MKKLFLLLALTIHIPCILSWEVFFPFDISIKIPQYFEPADKKNISQTRTQNIPVRDCLTFKCTTSSSTNKIAFSDLGNENRQNADELLKHFMNPASPYFSKKIVTYSTKHTPIFTAARCIFIVCYKGEEMAINSDTVYAYNNKAWIISHDVVIELDNDTKKAMDRINEFIDLNPGILDF